MMYMKLIMFVFIICLNGCAYIGEYYGGHPYPTGRMSLWSKKGFSDEEVRRFSGEVCYSMARGMRVGEMAENIELQIEGQKCMLEHGFYFKDAPYPHEKLCSNSYIKARDIKSYMIFPVCQAKYGKYRK